MCRVSSNVLGSAERDLGHPNPAWRLLTADAGMKPDTHPCFFYICYSVDKHDCKHGISLTNFAKQVRDKQILQKMPSFHMAAIFMRDGLACHRHL